MVTFGVGTISYNQANYLEECLSSVSSARSIYGFENVQHVVADPGSTDGSIDVINRFSDQCVLVGEPDSGPADGLNNCFKIIDADVGAFINSDDLLLPNSFKLVSEVFAAYPETDMVLGGGWLISEDSRPIKPVFPVQPSMFGLTRNITPMFQHGMFFKVSAFDKVCGFNVQNRTCWDLELLCDLLASGASFKIARERYGCFRVHSQSLTGGVAGESHRRRYFNDLERLKGKYDVGSRAFSLASLLHAKVENFIFNNIFNNYISLSKRRIEKMWDKDVDGLWERI